MARSALRAAAPALSGHMIASVHRYLPGKSGKTAQNRAPRSSCCLCPLFRTSARASQRCPGPAAGPAAAYKSSGAFSRCVRAGSDRSGNSIEVRSSVADRAFQDVVLPLALTHWTPDVPRHSRRPIASPLKKISSINSAERTRRACTSARFGGKAAGGQSGFLSVSCVNVRAKRAPYLGLARSLLRV